MADTGWSGSPRPVQRRMGESATGSNVRLPVRPAPPLPTNAKSKNKGPLAKSNQENSQDSSSNDKSTRRMFLFKKQSFMPSLKHKENSSTSNNAANESRPSQAEINKKKSKWSTPTIIRPAPNKKKLPPRPPPPKINKGNGLISVFPLDPPSYEEVLRADTRNQGRMPLARPRSTKGPAPQAPNVNATDPLLNSWPADDFYTPIDITCPLIDFSSPQLQINPMVPVNPVPVNNEQRKNSLSADLLGLDDLFNSVVQTEPNGNSWSFSTNLDEDSLRPTSQKNAQRPVPKPRTSLTNNSLASVSNETEGPALPPRPSLDQESLSHNSNGLFGDSSLPPPLPPRPKHYSDSSQEIDDFSSVSPLWQRTEPHGIALYDYATTQPDDLSFKGTDIITLIHRINEEWLYGCLGEREGMFPRNFVQIVIPLPDDPEFEEDGIPSVTGPRCLALFDYVSDQDDELSFQVGDMIQLVDRVSDYWLTGMLNGRTGMVPSNFVRIVQDLH